MGWTKELPQWADRGLTIGEFALATATAMWVFEPNKPKIEFSYNGKFDCDIDAPNNSEVHLILIDLTNREMLLDNRILEIDDSPFSNYRTTFQGQHTFSVNMTHLYAFSVGANALGSGAEGEWAHAWVTGSLTSVPEPATLLLLGLGLIGLAGIRRKFKS